MSPKFESLKAKWERGYITKRTLWGWVELNRKKTGAGITEEEYVRITGEAIGDTKSTYLADKTENEQSAKSLN